LGGFVLENFFIKKKVGAENAYLLHPFSKMPQDFLKKQNYRGSAAQIFFASWSKNFKNIPENEAS